MRFAVIVQNRFLWQETQLQSNQIKESGLTRVTHSTQGTARVLEMFGVWSRVGSLALMSKSGIHADCGSASMIVKLDKGHFCSVIVREKQVYTIFWTMCGHGTHHSQKIGLMDNTDALNCIHFSPTNTTMFFSDDY